MGGLALNGVGGGATERLHALDAVRAGALLLGVVLHATMSFFPMPIWIVQDAVKSGELFTTFFVIHIFRMSLFFIIAGFFAHMMLHRKGLGDFVRNRLIRIGLPLVVFWPLVLAAFIGVIVWSFTQMSAAIVAAGGEAPPVTPPPPMTAETFPWTHLWFLYLLLWLYAGALVLWGIGRIVDRNGVIGRGIDAIMRPLVKSQFAPLILAAPVAAMLIATPAWNAWLGVPTPDTGVVPNAIALTTYSIAFGFGWLLHRQIELIQTWRTWWPLHLAVAIGSTVAVLAVMSNAFPSLTPETVRVMSALLYAVAIWTWSFALIGLALRFLSGRNPAVRYLADASYWIYIIHLPIVLVMQQVVSQWQAPAIAKLGVIVGVSMVVMLASYQLMVRYTFIGSWLNGKKQKPGRQPKTQPVLAAAE